MKMDALGVCQLFQGIPDEERSSLLSCLQALKKEYKRGEILVHTGPNNQPLWHPYKRMPPYHKRGPPRQYCHRGPNFSR